MQRAATSIPLNIAEGAGEYSCKDKARFYGMSLRSATECAALLDVCRRLKVLEEQLFFAGRDLLVRIVAMLTKMVLNLVQEPGTGSGSGSEPDSSRSHEEGAVHAMLDDLVAWGHALRDMRARRTK